MRKLIAHLVGVGASPRIFEAASAAEAKSLLERETVDAIVTDLAMPGEDGLSLMQWAVDRGIEGHWIVLTGHGTLDKAVTALQLGAFDFISKPIESRERLRNAIDNALEQRRLTQQRDRLLAELRVSNERLRDHVEQLEGACRLLRDQAATIRADLQRAAIIQRSLLPESAPELKDYHVQAVYRPSEEVGGDLYDVVRVDARHVALLIADAAGHGLSAAMLAVHFRSQLKIGDPNVLRPHPPAKVLAAVNQSLCQSLPAPGLFLTAAYCLLDTERREITLASAGHTPLYRVRRGAAIERIPNSGPALGLTADACYSEHRISLEYGDALFFHTDGLYQALPETAKDLEALVAGIASPRGPGGSPYHGDLARVAAEIDARDEALVDDVTILMLGASPGLSLLDNGALHAAPATTEVPDAAQTLVGSAGRRITLKLPERGDWTQSAPFHLECAAAIERCCEVVVDLSACAQLDSTFLGTVHELCTLADAADVGFRLQGMNLDIERLFVELGMERVMDHIVAVMLPVPADMKPIRSAGLDATTRASLLLRAHEGLASLNAKNREAFAPLVNRLRDELGALTRNSTLVSSDGAGR